jgi:outer membrane protein assembly factor BamB
MKRLILPLLFLLAAWTGNARAADWSFWRGPEQNGVSREKDLPDSWSPDARAADNNLVWTAPYGGITTPIVQGGRLYFIDGTPDNNLHLQERVVCLDADTGKLKWEYKFNVFHSDIVRDRLGWTTMVGDPETGNVYAHGVQGLLFCFDKDGKVLWQHSLTEEYGRVSGYGGRTTSPIVDGDLLILGMPNASWGFQGMGRNRFVAFNKKTGAVEWWGYTGFPVKDTYYSIPVVAVIGGQRLIISGGADGGVHAFKVRTGEKVWSYIFGAGAVNCSPVVSGNFVFIGHGETNDDSARQGRVICVDGSVVENGQPKLVWKKDGIKAKFASPVIDKDRLYICNETADLYCLDAKDGKQLWRQQYGKNAKGSPLLADGKIYVGAVDGEFRIMKPSDKACEIIHTHEFEGTEINGSPIAVNGKVYFMTGTTTYCLGKKNHTAKAEPIPAAAQEPPSSPNPKAAHLQILPADVLLSPGESTEFKVRAFDDKGRLIGETKADWSLAGQRPPEGLPPAPPPPPGSPPPAPPPPLRAKLSETSGTSTKLTIDAIPAIQAGRVVVKVGDLAGEARVRVVPKLPFAADFSKVPEGRTPAGWVNCQGKFAVVKEGDKNVLKKLATNANALVARAITYIGSPHLTDYTISADVMATKVGEDMPDVGIIANRYRLELVGNTQTLRLTSWDALPRIDKTIAFKFQPKVWYSMKLTADIKGDKAIVRGKVWERGKDEPKDWTVQVEDPLPNREGAPALYGYATGIQQGQTGAEGFFDNVKLVSKKPAESKTDAKSGPTTITKSQPRPEARSQTEAPAAPSPVVENYNPEPYYVICPPYRTGLFGRLLRR